MHMAIHLAIYLAVHFLVDCRFRLRSSHEAESTCLDHEIAKWYHFCKWERQKRFTAECVSAFNLHLANIVRYSVVATWSADGHERFVYPMRRREGLSEWTSQLTFSKHAQGSRIVLDCPKRVFQLLVFIIFCHDLTATVGKSMPFLQSYRTRCCAIRFFCYIQNQN